MQNFQTKLENNNKIENNEEMKEEYFLAGKGCQRRWVVMKGVGWGDRKEKTNNDSGSLTNFVTLSPK